MRENYIPVLTGDDRPLAPCHPRRARGLVANGKASFKHKSGIRCIVIHKTNIPKVKRASKLVLRIDPGSKTTGIASTREHKDGSRTCLIGIEVKHQGKAISTRMTKRRQKRHTRRGRKTRFRQPRFNNRTRPDGWLSPSIRSRLQNTLTWVGRLSKMLPITEIHVETNVFDPQILRNPEIKGKQYQQGPLYQTNLRSAVLTRDQNKCVYCGKSGKNSKLQLDHVVPRASNGANRYDNLVATCKTCNLQKANTPLETFLKRRPKKLAEIKQKLGMDLAAATHMNIIIPALLRELHNQGWTVAEHAAATTAAGRLLCGVEKSHHGDAAVTGCPTRLRYIPDAPITVTATGRGNRQRIMPDKNGTPRGKGFREYSKLPRHIQRKTPTPSHKKRQKRVGNVATGDHVTFIHNDVRVHGYGTISKKGVALTKPKWRSIKAEEATVTERNHGYQIKYPNPEHKGNLGECPNLNVNTP